ncbi:hypothetical protein [Klebsiella pneumoniae]|uniref:hypothetical protein n=1 Tax=Klebsiella pneumoniae TaxID=573 RepID=UPI0028769992|nr:hypothetical protein [Klebsiella pneumoniae]MDS0508365.1 hypothetical protein [Klebsiella pneumoniae]MDU9069074.1 hypothetical protein [Klebsiella pneumoniae]MDU9079889.1 hypothetical protein [Klebsiella pneumoniae]HBS2480738.1 hypothetical protein [Klebsiella pneumoniae]HBS7344188.1 hypothetical protein [Klebsiella pneumoniae]
MINNIVYLITKFLNYSLLMHTSDDENFDTLEVKQQCILSNLRLSLLAIPLGNKIYYICTYKKIVDNILKKENYSFTYILDYDLKWGRKSPDLIEKSVSEYVKNIENQSVKKTEEQEEFLKQRISENNESMSTIRNKITHYTTIMFALASGLTYLYTKISVFIFPNLQALIYYYLLLIITTQVLNLALFLRKGMMTSSFYQSSFKELRTSTYKCELTKSFYRDWLAKNDDVRYFTGIVKNAEKHLYRSICIGLIAFLVVSTFPNENVKQNNHGISKFSENYII